jgi:mono/diheme cytochrome c family protein
LISTLPSATFQRAIGRFLSASRLAAVLALGCAGPILVPTGTDAVRASVAWPGTTVAELTEGRRLYLQRCSGCHALYRPEARAPSLWPKIVHAMTVRSRLTEATARDITRYLVVASGAPR